MAVQLNPDSVAINGTNSIAFSVMYFAVAVQVAGTAVASIIDPGGFVINTRSGDLQHLPRSAGFGQEINQVRVHR